MMCLPAFAREDVVMVANANVPASIELARYYLKLRDIPEDRLFVFPLPEQETISRTFFEQKLRDPLLQGLRDKGLIRQVQRNPETVRAHESAWTTVDSKIHYIVCMYGVPLRVADIKPFGLQKLIDVLSPVSQKDSAALDSELALVLHVPYDLKGRIANPVYRALRWSDLGKQHYQILVAARLDGPTPEIVRRMIDDAIWAETYGLNGRMFFDSRKQIDDEYAPGDYVIREAYERFRREGYECVMDKSDSIWGLGFPMENAALYFGWYWEQVEGPFRRDDFKFQRGAIAYHLHSANAKTLRSTTNYWVGPLLSKGAAASMGAVDEPYLAYMPDLQIFSDRLCRGLTFGESMYMALPVASWQVTVVGDPLYAPFKLSLDEQIKALEKADLQDVEWAYLRKINLFIHEGLFNVALNYCREQLRKRESLVLREKLADLYAMNELIQPALQEYAKVVNETKTAETAVRAGGHYVRLLKLVGKNDVALDVENKIRERWPNHPAVSTLSTSNP